MELIGSWHEFKALSTPWNELAARCHHPFLRHEWLWSCARACHTEKSLRIGVLRQHGRPVAIAPLVLTGGERSGSAWLELPASRVIPTPSGLLYTDETALADLIRAIIKLGYPLRLERLETASPLLTRLQQSAPSLAMVFTKPAEPVEVVIMDADWEAFQHTLTPRFRDNLARFAQRAEGFGDVTFTALAPLPEEAETLTATALGLRSTNGQRARETLPLTALDKNAVLRSVAQNMASSGMLRVLQLHFGDRIAAAAMGLEIHQRFWQLQDTYDPSFARCYPRLLLMHACIERAYRTGLNSIECVGPSAAWRKPWNLHHRHFNTAELYPRTTAGLAALAASSFRS